MATEGAVDQKDRARQPVFLGWVALIIGCLWMGSVLVDPADAASRRGPCTVLRVYDGDTILVDRKGHRQVIRLLGIDAPETAKDKGKPGQPYSRKSQRHLASLILNQTIMLAVYGEDRYQRTLAIVYHGTRDINHAMIQAGLAEVYRGRTPEGFDKTAYLQSEATARQARVGMWQQGSAYKSPIRWKHDR